MNGILTREEFLLTVLIPAEKDGRMRAKAKQAKAKKVLAPGQQAKRYGKAWKVALCGPHGTGAEVDLSAERVAYRLEKAWLAGFCAARAVIAAVEEK